MSNTLRGMALVAYALMVSVQPAVSGSNSNLPGGCACIVGEPCPCAPLSVPEPGTLALMATGIGVLALARFRKRT
jgi:hypothetical protein